jgi:aspartyl-tRNA(Asn)/glutamyl-tRNA(Gln) amidotransferase subunit B
VCLGLPGALPAANEKAVEYAVRIGLATNSAIARRSVFARKNYFYPDCPKNYQITQYELPLCSDGHILLEGGRTRIGIKRIHLEEDAGKLLHPDSKDYSYIDMNRAGVPLIEIVSEPDIRRPKDAGLYLQKLRSILRYLEICDGNMEEGSLRCDVNVSLREQGSTRFGTKIEVKNLNSFKAVEQALAFEIERQERILLNGGEIRQATMLWDSARGQAQIMRSKEEEQDYRYFPEPDLLILEVPEDLIVQVKAELPELPDARAARFVDEYGLPPYDAQVLTGSKEIADYFEAAAHESNDPKASSNWIMGEVLRELKERGIEITRFKVTPKHLASLIDEVKTGRINMPTAKEIIREMADSGREAESIIAGKGLGQISDESELERIVAKVLDGHPEEVSSYLEGKTKLLKYFVGQVMKESGGRANPRKTAALLKAGLEKLR